MKNQNGITLVSLVIYVIIMIIVTGIMGSIINEFYTNTETVQGNVKEIVEFNKFNTYFLKEVKSYGNEVDHIDNSQNYILFKSGNAFSLSNNNIYYNNLKICSKVQDINISFGTYKNGEGTEVEDNTVIKVTLKFSNFEKSIKYKVENIY